MIGVKKTKFSSVAWGRGKRDGKEIREMAMFVDLNVSHR
jgi:hypothetical protein